MKFRAALRAPRGGPPRQQKLPEGGPVPAPRSEPDAIRDGVSRRASDKGDGPSPPQPKGQVHFRVCPKAVYGSSGSGPARPEGYFETCSWSNRVGNGTLAPFQG